MFTKENHVRMRRFWKDRRKRPFSFSVENFENQILKFKTSPIPEDSRGSLKKTDCLLKQTVKQCVHHCLRVVWPTCLSTRLNRLSRFRLIKQKLLMSFRSVGNVCSTKLLNSFRSLSITFRSSGCARSFGGGIDGQLVDDKQPFVISRSSMGATRSS